MVEKRNANTNTKTDRGRNREWEDGSRLGGKESTDVISANSSDRN